LQEPREYRTWLGQARLLLLGSAFGLCLPLLIAVGQTPPRVQFGVIKSPEDKSVALPAIDSAQPDKNGKQKKPVEGEKGGGVLLYAMPVTPPAPDQLFRLDSEEGFRNRLRTEVRERAPKHVLEFPDAKPVPGQPASRDWPAYVKLVEPHYVVSKRLFFEQPRYERYGEGRGVLQPALSTGIFGLDLFLWPTRRLAQPFRCYQVNTDGYSPYFQLVGQ